MAALLAHDGIRVQPVDTSPLSANRQARAPPCWSPPPTGSPANSRRPCAPPQPRQMRGSCSSPEARPPSPGSRRAPRRGPRPSGRPSPRPARSRPHSARATPTWQVCGAPPTRPAPNPATPPPAGLLVPPPRPGAGHGRHTGVARDHPSGLLGHPAQRPARRTRQRLPRASTPRLLPAPALVPLPSSTDASAAPEGPRGFLELVPAGWRWASLQLRFAAVVAAIWRGRRLGPVVREDLTVVVRASGTTEAGPASTTGRTPATRPPPCYSGPPAPVSPKSRCRGSGRRHPRSAPADPHRPPGEPRPRPGPRFSALRPSTDRRCRSGPARRPTRRPQKRGTHVMRAPPPDADEAAEAHAALEAVRAEIGKAVVGQDPVVTGLVIALLPPRPRPAGGHPRCRQDPAGTRLGRGGRTGNDTRPVHSGPDAQRRHRLPRPRRPHVEVLFQPGPVFTNLLRAYEINRTLPKRQASLLEATEESQVTVDGTARHLPEPVPGRRHAEPGGVRGHVAPTGSPVGPVLSELERLAPAQGRRDRAALTSCAGIRPA
ncbi:ATPase family associated with various cellular activities (AAA) [Streptomyces sp. ADI96-15]|nr:ATPase family associated with various cellular activities (AAA) [Streptomyces sp. ADI96-15]